MISISDSANNGQHESLRSLRLRGWSWEDIFLFAGEWYDDDTRRAARLARDFKAAFVLVLHGDCNGLYALFSNGLDPLWDGLDPLKIIYVGMSQGHLRNALSEAFIADRIQAHRRNPKLGPYFFRTSVVAVRDPGDIRRLPVFEQEAIAEIRPWRQGWRYLRK